jgi:hypothetical protein
MLRAKKNSRTGVQCTLILLSAKLANNQGNVSKLTKIEIAAILLVGHSIDVGPMTRKANKKEALVARLEERIKASIDGSILTTGTSAIDASGGNHMDLDSDSDGQAVPGGMFRSMIMMKLRHLLQIFFSYFDRCLLTFLSSNYNRHHIYM